MNTCRVGFGYSSFHLKRAEDVGKGKMAGSGNTLVARAALLVAFLSSSAHSAPFSFLSPILLGAKSGLWSTEDSIIDSFSGRCRPSDKLGGGWSSRPCDKGGAVSKRNIFSPFGTQFGLKIRGRHGLRGPLPLIRHWVYSTQNLCTVPSVFLTRLSFKSCHGYLISLFTVIISDLLCFAHFLYTSMSMRSPHVSSTVLMKTSEAFFHLLMTNDAFL